MSTLDSRPFPRFQVPRMGDSAARPQGSRSNLKLARAHHGRATGPSTGRGDRSTGAMLGRGSGTRAWDADFRANLTSILP